MGLGLPAGALVVGAGALFGPGLGLLTVLIAEAIHWPAAQLAAVPWAAAAKNGALAGQNAQGQAAGAADWATSRPEVSAAATAGADPDEFGECRLCPGAHPAAALCPGLAGPDPTLCPDGAGRGHGS